VCVCVHACVRPVAVFVQAARKVIPTPLARSPAARRAALGHRRIAAALGQLSSTDGWR
jgi:hypothetical protein